MAVETLSSTPATQRIDIPAGGTSGRKKSALAPRIIDIRTVPDELDLANDIHKSLRPEGGGEKTLPTLLLYDELGLKLFEEITFLPEYYLTNAEISVLEKYADKVAERITPGSILLELGSGNLRKVNILLAAIERAKKDVQYYALDVSLDELKRTLADVPLYKFVKCAGLHGTYDDGLEWLKSPAAKDRSKTILSLGSSIGNFKRDAAVSFVHGFANALQPGDNILIGIDSCTDPDKVFHAYNDRDGITHRFILNGLAHANKLLASKANFQLEDWEVIGAYDRQADRHHAFVSPKKDVNVDGIEIRHGERIRIEESYKWSPTHIERLWERVGLVEGSSWFNERGDYGLHMSSKANVVFPSEAAIYAKNKIPSLDDWSQLWAAWDAVTLDMIPKEELLSKPIKLRNACIFYLGHIPTFLDIHLTRATDGPPTEPAQYPKIFERGIDPDVENPEICHDHSVVPEKWPPLEEIKYFQHRVRERVKKLYDVDGKVENKRIARALWLGFEHEAMHLETLLYMLIQSEKTLPPPGVVVPDFEGLSHRKKDLGPSKWFKIPEADIVMGMEDPEEKDDFDQCYGWDNEIPRRVVHVKAFEAQARPITNGEYAEYLNKTGSKHLPASWCDATSTSNGVEVSNGTEEDVVNNKFVRTVFGIVPLKYVLDWPIAASFDELKGYATWRGGRIPTAEEVRSIYNYVDASQGPEVEKTLGNTIPAVNGHLSNDGVQETPPSQFLSNGSSSTTTNPDVHKLFTDLNGANVGFKHWHPVSVALNPNKLAGQGGMGGVWEWTSTVLEKHKGFKPMELYPGYTSDFFDGKHNIVLGGSWATHPRMAGRKTFVNWYQRNYPYVWAGARLVRDF